MKTKNKSSLTEVAKWQRRRKIKQMIAASVCGVIAVISAVISFGAFGSNAWEEIYGALGISDFSDSAKGYPLCVSFIDVGDGDCILIECEGHAALIDSGALSLDGIASKYIKKRNIESLDFILCTHWDDDHIGDMRAVIENVNVQKCYVTRLAEEKVTGSTKRLVQTLNEKAITKETLDCGSVIRLGGMILEVISPKRVYDEDNDNSIVFRAVYGEVSFLLTGDAGEEAEADIIASENDIKSTVLKVAHHGSKTATTENFLKAVSPQIAIISVGDTNKYLPNRDTVERIESFGCELLRTDEDGTIILASDGKKIYKYKEKK